MPSHRSQGWLLAQILRLRALAVAQIGAALVEVECDWAGMRLLDFANVKICGGVSSKICRGFTASVPHWFPQPQRLLGSPAEPYPKNHGYSCHMAGTGSSCSSLSLTISRPPFYACQNSGYSETTAGNLCNALKGWGNCHSPCCSFSARRSLKGWGFLSWH